MTLSNSPLSVCLRWPRIPRRTLKQGSTDRWMEPLESDPTTPYLIIEGAEGGSFCPRQPFRSAPSAIY